MNFSRVETFVIPEGNVKNVSSGNEILWEANPFPSWYKCNPTISITYESKTATDTNKYRCGFSCSIGGITRALISKIEIVNSYYRETASGRPILQYSYYPCVVSDNAATENKYSFSQYVNYSVPSALYYSYRFVLRITYTDLNGNEKTLATNYVASVGASANASA